MGSGASANRLRSKLIGAMVLLLVFVFLVWSVELGTAYNAVARNACTKNLRSLDAVVREHLSQRGTLPTSPDGRVGLNGLLQQSSRSGRNTIVQCSGHAENVDDVYCIAQRLAKKIQSESESELPTIIICDKPGNHILRRWNGLAKRENWKLQEMACLLLSDGRVITWHGNAVDYAEWMNGYLSGAPNAAQYPPGIEELLTESLSRSQRR